MRALVDGTETRAFVVVDRDRIVYERYFDGAGPRTLGTSFSVAKSLLSTLVGIAIDRGRIGSVGDPVTVYVPELAERDPRFRQITLADLLTMRSGLRYEESAFPWPFGDDTPTYYGIKPAPGRAQAQRDPRHAGRAVALQQLQPPPTRPGARARHGRVGFAVRGAGTVEAARRGTRCLLEP